MKKILFSVFIIGFGLAVQAQNNQRQEAKAKLEAARIALITDRLNLTPEQAEKFWPIYNEYAEQRRAIHREFKQSQRSIDMKNMTEEQSREMMKARMEAKQKQLDLEKKYSERLMNVINTRQLMALKKAEDDFRAMIIRRLEQRRQQQMQRQQMMMQRERKIQQGNN